jgi:hypothetical protein
VGSVPQDPCRAVGKCFLWTYRGSSGRASQGHKVPLGETHIAVNHASTTNFPTAVTANPSLKIREGGRYGRHGRR